MANIECVNFTLKTMDINTSITYGDYTNDIDKSPTGTIKNKRTDYTWYNVNIRNIIGETMYKKYDKFNICLNSIAMSSRGGGNDTENNNCLSIKMGGLSWCSSYDQATRNNNYFQTIRLVKLPHLANATDSQQFYDKIYLTFNKNSDSCNINLKFNLISNDGIPAYTGDTLYLGHFAFNFSIYPVT